MIFSLLAAGALVLAPTVAPGDVPRACERASAVGVTHIKRCVRIEPPPPVVSTYERARAFLMPAMGTTVVRGGDCDPGDEGVSATGSTTDPDIVFGAGWIAPDLAGNYGLLEVTNFGSEPALVTVTTTCRDTA